jgi:hypothetical protein
MRTLRSGKSVSEKSEPASDDKRGLSSNTVSPLHSGTLKYIIIDANLELFKP